SGDSAFDTSRPHPARRYDALLGGKDNFAADRESAHRIAQAFPTIRTAARENRRFLPRVVKHLAGHARINQFPDIRTRNPTPPPSLPTPTAPPRGRPGGPCNEWSHIWPATPESASPSTSAPAPPPRRTCTRSPKPSPPPPASSTWTTTPS